MKKTFLLISLGFSSQLFAQNNWTKIGPPPPAIQIIDEFIQVAGSAHAFADVDNDGDQDVLITGLIQVSSSFESYLYINDGTGAFTHDTNNTFDGNYQGDVAFGDLDGDGDQDLIITGMGNSVLYVNDGTGSFTMTSAPFEGVSYSALALLDADGDLDLDVFIGGQAGGGSIANFYMNDGSANFTLNTIASSTFPGIYFGAAEFGDVDSDGDADLILMGYGNSGSHSELFLNDGNAVFTLASSNFPTLNSCDIAFSDVDGDSDLDVLISGENPNVGAFTALYLNDGNGIFTVSSNGFSQATSASMDFGDIDNDGDEDLLLSGNTSGIGSASLLYKNNGSGVFTVIPGPIFYGVNNGSSTLTDIDGDSDLDMLVSGNNHTDMYLNDGNGNYSALPTTPFTGITQGGVEFADADTDGDLDVLITGQEQSGAVTTKLYLNDGTGAYQLDNTNTFPAIANSAADFADIDGDGDLDLLLSGYGTGQLTQLFTNDGSGAFTLVSSPFPPASSGSIEFHDVDNDGDQDVVLTGFNNFGNVGKLWMNDGTGSFTVSANNFEGASSTSVSFADIDGDNDDDLLMTGYGDIDRIAKLYTNDGTGMFTLIASPFPGVQQGATDFADIDGDGDQDLVIAGEIGSASYTAQLFTNDGTGVFTLVAGTPFDPTITSGMIFSDIDNDLDMDLMTIGSNNVYQTIAKMYANDGTGAFTLISGTPFEGASGGMMAFGDIDGDNDDDLVVAGNGASGVKTNLYRNDNCQQSNVFDEHNECAAYTWIDGVTYTQSNSTATMNYINVAGCDSVIFLQLIIGDMNGIPTLADLPNVIAECDVTSIIAPTATLNCSGMVAATTDQVFPITLQDTTQIVWTYTGSNGFEMTQTQLVVILDVTAPVPDMASLPTAISPCPFTTLSIIPTATDNCGGTIIGTSTDFPVTTPGTTTITWTFTDANGNTSTQTEDLIYTPLNDEVTFDGTTLTATQTFTSYQWYDCDAEENIQGATSQTYNPTTNGSYSVTVSNNECSVTSDCFTLTNLAASEFELSRISIYPNPNAGSFTIETSNALSITISNAAGQLVHSETLPIGKSEMNLKTLESGIYFVNSIHANGSMSIQKVSILK